LQPISPKEVVFNFLFTPMQINAIRIGNGKPTIAIVGCLHGDEIIGQKVIAELRKVRLLRGSLNLIIANEKAMQAKKRMLQKDLNRSFPGKKNGTYEERLARVLHQEIRQADLVIDIHATTANFDGIAIVMDLKKTTQNILRLVPCQKVALLRKTVFGGGEMLRFAKAGLAFEFGPNKKGANYKKALAEILALLRNLNLIGGTKKYYRKKELYTVKGSYKITNDFQVNGRLRNFKLIRKGDFIGKASGKKIKSDQTFYPIFLGEESYKDILSIIATRSKLNLI
jgi:succinylglutamate desuccinylase